MGDCQEQRKRNPPSPFCFLLPLHFDSDTNSGFLYGYFKVCFAVQKYTVKSAMSVKIYFSICCGVLPRVYACAHVVRQTGTRRPSIARALLLSGLKRRWMSDAFRVSWTKSFVQFVTFPIDQLLKIILFKRHLFNWSIAELKICSKSDCSIATSSID